MLKPLSIKYIRFSSEIEFPLVIRIKTLTNSISMWQFFYPNVFLCVSLFFSQNIIGNSKGAKMKREVNYWFRSRTKSLYRTFGYSTRCWIFWKTFMWHFSSFWPFFWWLYLKQYYTLYFDWDEPGADAKHKRNFSVFFPKILWIFHSKLNNWFSF